MSVIGRLDEQVDAVLISPLGKKGSAPERETRPAHAAEQTNTPREEESSAREEGREKKRAAELPVWLL